MSQVELQATTPLLRSALWEVCEIIRLCNYNPALRKGVETVRDMIMEKTKSQVNLLPHEITDKKYLFSADKKKLSPLLPRFDNQ